METPFKPRQFVWCQFPYIEEPLRPGPKEHIGYVADIRQVAGNIHLTVMSIYTTSKAWEPGMTLPLGIVPVEPDLARSMNQQKGFVMDVRKIAFIPVNLDYFPRLSEPNKGIVGTASERFHNVIQNTLAQLAKRPDLLVKLGPDSPSSPSRNHDKPK